MENRVFRELTLKWQGKEYKVTPSMSLLRSIEMGDISFMDIALRTTQGRPPFSHLATVVAKLLEAAGANASEEAVYMSLTGGKEEETTSLITAAMIAFAPHINEGDAEKKDAARTPAKK